MNHGFQRQCAIAKFFLIVCFLNEMIWSLLDERTFMYFTFLRNLDMYYFISTCNANILLNSFSGFYLI